MTDEVIDFATENDGATAVGPVPGAVPLEHEATTVHDEDRVRPRACRKGVVRDLVHRRRVDAVGRRAGRPYRGRPRHARQLGREVRSGCRGTWNRRRTAARLSVPLITRLHGASAQSRTVPSEPVISRCTRTR